jgi:hypothetical protein
LRSRIELFQARPEQVERLPGNCPFQGGEQAVDRPGRGGEREDADDDQEQRRNREERRVRERGREEWHMVVERGPGSGNSDLPPPAHVEVAHALARPVLGFSSG